MQQRRWARWLILAAALGVAGTGASEPTGDINFDGRVDAGDALLVERYLQGQTDFGQFCKNAADDPASPRIAADVAPLVGGVSVPDGAIDGGDLAVLHRTLGGEVALAGLPRLAPLDPLVAFTPIGGPDVRVMSYNLRFWACKLGENDWHFRRQMVFDILRDHRPDVVGLQEALSLQVDDILEALPEYASVVFEVPPHADPILYRKDRFEVLSSDAFRLDEYLADSEYVCGWIPRYVTWVRLRDKQSLQSFYVHNTHFCPNKSPFGSQVPAATNREVHAMVMASVIDSREGQDDPVVVAGDLNAGDDQCAIKYLKGEPNCRGTNPAPLLDSYRSLHLDETLAKTTNSFSNPSYVGTPIDYVLVRQHAGVCEADIVHRRLQLPSGVIRYPSDHYPVYALVNLFDPAGIAGGCQSP
jgi:endonuclease/exonuclease/phosphatase family metal-dependent hydrolase